MPIGTLEPLYRYLQLHNAEDAISAVINDMEALAKDGFIKSIGEGLHETLSTSATEAEINETLTQLLNKESPAFYTASYQALDSKMFISISRVEPAVSRTILALCINEDDSVTTFYLDGASMIDMGLKSPELYSSTSAVIKTADGTLKNGFVRSFTSVRKRNAAEVYIKCDFRLSRTTPFYIAISDVYENQRASIGAAAKAVFDELEATCSR